MIFSISKNVLNKINFSITFLLNLFVLFVLN